MAVKDDDIFYPTERIVSKEVRKHYRIPVRSQHWQLRSLISAEDKCFVYFPGGHGSNHVQRLNTQTHECETIKLLSFAPRCLVAKGGWLCCGSETGEFVAIRVDEDSIDAHDSPYLDPETRLSLTLDETHDEPLSYLAAQARRANKNSIAKSMKLAKDRVNCITLWFPSRTSLDEAYIDPVAVLANNDRTVTIVNLEECDDDDKVEPLAVITYPDFVNRALISPDGSLLIAILDDPYLYVHERILHDDKPAMSRNREISRQQWEERQRILLKSQTKDDKSDSRGSFAACFSPSGAYLAVGTQHGTISIFDAELLKDASADPLITTFQSSRPESGPGAVRDMEFCPGSFDILAWTEDRGRVGLADVRTGYVFQQIISIENEADFEHIDILDRNTIDPRLLEARNRRNLRDARQRDTQPEASGSDSPSRTVDDSNAFNRPLNDYEIGLISAVTRNRTGQRNRTHGRGTEDAARGTADITWSSLSNLRPSADDPESPHSQERSNSVSRLLSTGPLGRERRDRHPLQRLRSNRQAMQGNTDRQRDAHARPSEQTLLDILGGSSAAARELRERQDTSYLNVLEILQGSQREDDRDEPATRTPLVNRLASRWEESAIRGTLPPDAGVFEVPPSPDNTAGLAWSEDGRTLFVGAQNGIYEFHIDVQGRKFNPSIDMR